MRHFILVLLLLLLPWKAFASTMDAVWHETSHFAQVVGHEMEHRNGVAHHHHHDNNAIHYDNSEESKKHLYEHLCLHYMAVYEIDLSANALPKFFVFPSIEIIELASVSLFPSSVFLGGLQRPPSLLD